MSPSLTKPLDAVLVRLGSRTGYHRLGGLKGKHLFLTVLGSSPFWGVQDQGAGRSSVWRDHSSRFADSSLHATSLPRLREGWLCFSLSKDTNPFLGAPSS